MLEKRKTTAMNVRWSQMIQIMMKKKIITLTFKTKCS